MTQWLIHRHETNKGGKMIKTEEFGKKVRIGEYVTKVPDFPSHYGPEFEPDYCELYACESCENGAILTYDNENLCQDCYFEELKVRIEAANKTWVLSEKWCEAGQHHFNGQAQWFEGGWDCKECALKPHKFAGSNA